MLHHILISQKMEGISLLLKIENALTLRAGFLSSISKERLLVTRRAFKLIRRKTSRYFLFLEYSLILCVKQTK